jgi:hypothetical protein
MELKKFPYLTARLSALWGPLPPQVMGIVAYHWARGDRQGRSLDLAGHRSSEGERKPWACGDYKTGVPPAWSPRPNPGHAPGHAPGPLPGVRCCPIGRHGREAPLARRLLRLPRSCFATLPTALRFLLSPASPRPEVAPLGTAFERDYRQLPCCKRADADTEYE